MATELIENKKILARFPSFRGVAVGARCILPLLTGCAPKAKKIFLFAVIILHSPFSILNSYAENLEVIDSIPHVNSHFTQGLFFDGEDLWESTGLVGQSKIYRMNKKGEIFDSIAMRGNHFGEGSAKIGNKMLWLTWRSNMGFVLSAQPLRFVNSFRINGEGWGLSVWNGNWIMSDGSSALTVLSAENLSTVKKIETKIKNLNELEVVGDTLYANVWQSDSIAVISLPSGNLIKWLDFSQKAKSVRKSEPNAEVLNGIAYDGKNLWITGKNWGHIYKVNID